jgi:hypothetical protein
MSRKKDVLYYSITRHEIYWTRIQNNDLHRVNILNVLFLNETNRVREQFYGDINNEDMQNR